MLTVITEYQTLARDANGNTLPLGKGKLATNGLTTPGTQVLQDDTRFVRVATDTALQIRGIA